MCPSNEFRLRSKKEGVKMKIVRGELKGAYNSNNILASFGIICGSCIICQTGIKKE